MVDKPRIEAFNGQGGKPGKASIGAIMKQYP
jgi:hypothetical protein